MIHFNYGSQPTSGGLGPGARWENESGVPDADPRPDVT